MRPALAQNVGSLSGYVYDQSGVPLRGVTVTISSPTQIGGTKSTTTSDEGAFRFQGLFPGRVQDQRLGAQAARPWCRRACASASPHDRDRRS